ncbi:hypothetical protein AVEN_157672-1 [Araneus ventricosus]|uniref:HTH psq-type domain-containing protein n=1 Tax=Araneus ventricosus TaxID=182803 RepID=A0A4Y2URW2_ARAVE|nr:hypothetical protein AVEN_157672-1 [Araneus ventricosus]
MSGVKRNVLNVKQKLEILQKLDNGESSSTDAEDVLNEGNTISHSVAPQSVETLLDYIGQRGFDYGDITADHGGLVVRCRSIPGSKPDSAEHLLCIGPAARQIIRSGQTSSHWCSAEVWRRRC